MENSQALSPLRESDYEAIEAAVMETEKGRWFLFEYSRRHRSADKAMKFSTHDMLRSEGPNPSANHLRNEACAALPPEV